jgi:hypothetical protein
MASKCLTRATPSQNIHHLSNLSFQRPHVLTFLAPSIIGRKASGLSKGKKKDVRETPAKTKKEKKNFKRDDLKGALQFSLCDAMR